MKQVKLFDTESEMTTSKDGTLCGNKENSTVYLKTLDLSNKAKVYFTDTRFVDYARTVPYDNPDYVNMGESISFYGAATSSYYYAYYADSEGKSTGEVYQVCDSTEHYWPTFTFNEKGPFLITV